MNALAPIFAMFRHGEPWGFEEIAIAVVAALAICGLVVIFSKVSGVPIPPWVWQVIGIVVAAVVIIWAIRFIGGM